MAHVMMWCNRTDPKTCYSVSGDCGRRQ